MTLALHDNRSRYYAIENVHFSHGRIHKRTRGISLETIVHAYNKAINKSKKNMELELCTTFVFTSGELKIKALMSTSSVDQLINYKRD